MQQTNTPVSASPDRSGDNQFGKVRANAGAAVYDIEDGSTILVGGFGDSGIPLDLLHALREQGAQELTVVSINAGSGTTGISAIIASGQVRRIICSFPRTAGSVAFEAAYRKKAIELELVGMTLVERIRAGGSGIAAFYTKTGVGTLLSANKEHREFGGETHVLEHAIRADYAFVRAHCADDFGNLFYRGTDRNLNPVIAKAARCAIAQVDQVVPCGDLAAHSVGTPGVYIKRFVQTRDASPAGDLIHA